MKKKIFNFVINSFGFENINIMYNDYNWDIRFRMYVETLIDETGFILLDFKLDNSKRLFVCDEISGYKFSLYKKIQFDPDNLNNNLKDQIFKIAKFLKQWQNNNGKLMSALDLRQDATIKIFDFEDLQYFETDISKVYSDGQLYEKYFVTDGTFIVTEDGYGYNEILVDFNISKDLSEELASFLRNKDFPEKYILTQSFFCPAQI